MHGEEKQIYISNREKSMWEIMGRVSNGSLHGNRRVSNREKLVLREGVQ